MRVTGFRMCPLIASALLLSACARVPSNVRPDPPEYSDAFQARAAGEMAGDDRRPCDRIQPRGDCSAMKRMIIDYGHMREEIRAAGGGDE